ncbi:MAG: hypothetical protein JW940_08645 [Polyangiaceae bacterium]|nr:hypothetical protein [Polyangiaceae bacterium]
MASQTRALIDELIQLRTAQGKAKGTDHFLRAHLILHGIDPDAVGPTDPDDPEHVRVLRKMINDFRLQGR